MDQTKTDVVTNVLEKCATGIQGFDEISYGGLPKGRPSLVCGAAGCGKTLFGMEFLVRGAVDYDEPGLFVSFEEDKVQLAQNFASMGFDLPALEQAHQLLIDQVVLQPGALEQSGDFDLEALFIRLGDDIRAIGARRVVLDTIEALFSRFAAEHILRAELHRLFQWLKEQGVTAVITAERGHSTLTRQGLEEYVSDCVILLDHRVEYQVSTRRLRIVKYRGSRHGTNEYPFLISDHGIVVMPVTSLELEHSAPPERISSGIPGLDEMLEGKGFYRGSSILLSGTPGSGKSSMAAAFVEAACKRGERCLYFAFEESTNQFVRNMLSIGIALRGFLDQDQLRYMPTRPLKFGLEMHLAAMYQAISEFQPSIVVIDPITDFMAIGSDLEVKLMLTRLIDFMKMHNITVYLISLTTATGQIEGSMAGVSSLADTWMHLRDIEEAGERNHGIYVLKSRGMAHSNQIREFVLTEHGMELLPAYLGGTDILTGSARVAKENEDKLAELLHQQEIERRTLVLERKRKALQSQIAALEVEVTAEEAELQKYLQQLQLQQENRTENRNRLAHSRQTQD